MSVCIDDIEEARARAQAYRFLASVFFKELEEGQVAFLRRAPLPAGENERMRRGAAEMHRCLRLAAPDVVTRLRVDYARVFLAAGVFEGDTAVPYESVFTGGGGLMMQDARDDVLRCYAEDQMAVDRSLKTPEDHIAFELEYLAILCDRLVEALEEGCDERVRLILQKQERFLHEHVLNWVDRLAERVTAFSREAFYPAFMDYAVGFAECDAELLGEALSRSRAVAVQ